MIRRRDVIVLLGSAALAAIFADQPHAAMGQPSAQAAGSRYAILIGINGDAYRKLPHPEWLRGAAKDIERMRDLLLLCGFPPDKIRIVPGAQATGSALRAALAGVAAQTKPGDSVVLYFSGRGGTTAEGAPTLVPCDGQAEDAGGDIPLDEVADWTKTLAGHNVVTSVILDTSFWSLADRSLEQATEFNPHPRQAIRPSGSAGKPRSNSWWRGAGLFLSASSPNGKSYEMLIDAGSDTWGGVFTDAFSLRAARALHGGATPSASDLLASINQQFAAMPGYMPGFAPYPSVSLIAEDVRPRYEGPIFDLGSTQAAHVAGASLPPTLATHSSGDVLRVAVGVRDLRAASSNNISRAEIESLIRTDLADVSEHAVLLGHGEGAAERMVLVEQLEDDDGERFRARVSGSDWEDHNVVDVNAVCRGRAALSAFLRDAISPEIRVQGLVKRLFNLTGAARTAAEDASAVITVTPYHKSSQDFATLAPGEYWAIAGVVAKPGLLFVMERFGEGGIVQLIWPWRIDTANDMTVGAYRIPHIPSPLPKGVLHGPSFRIFEKMAEGAVTLRLAFISLPPTFPIVALPASARDGRFSDVSGEWWRSLAGHLQSVVACLGSAGQAELVVRDISYSVKNMDQTAAAMRSARGRITLESDRKLC